MRVVYNMKELRKLSKKQLRKTFNSKTSPTLEMVFKRLGYDKDS